MKVGIIGAGNIAGKMAATLQKMDSAEAYAVAARDGERARAFAEKWGIPRSYGSYEELVQDEEVELVYIATPHSHHYAHARLCIEHGKPILCEKSFTANAKQAKEIIKLAEERKIFLTEAIWTRYMPSRKIIEDVIKSGEIGEIVSLTANLGYDIQKSDRITNPALAGGALLDVGIYPLNFASMFLGNDIEEVISACVKFDTGVDAQNSIIIKYKNGVMASLQSSALASTEQYGIITGTKGYLIAEDINNITAVRIYSQDRELVREVPLPEKISGYEYQVEACKKALEEGRLYCEEMPHEETIELMEQMDALREAWGIRYPFE